MLFPCFLFIDRCCFCACRMWMISLSTRRRFCWNITTESRMLQPSLTEWSDHTKVSLFVSVQSWKVRLRFRARFRVSSNSLNRHLEFYIKENCDTDVHILCVSCLDAADDINRIASSLYTLGTQDSTDLCKYEQMLSLNFSCRHVMNISFLLTLVFGPEQSQAVNIPASRLLLFCSLFLPEGSSSKCQSCSRKLGYVWSNLEFALLSYYPLTLMLGPCFGVFFKQKIEARIAADEDLKLADLLKYYLRESQAAKVWLTVEVTS